MQGYKGLIVLGIRGKTLLIVGTAFLILMGCLVATSHFVIVGGFASLEEESVRVSVERFENELDNIFNELERTAEDWASWDETYLFVDGRNEAFLGRDLAEGTLQVLNIDIMALVNSSGHIAHAAFRDASNNLHDATGSGPGNEAGGSALEEILQRILSAKELIDLDMNRDRAHGFLMISGKPFFISSKAIVKSDFSGPVNGTLLIGRFFDAGEVDRLAGKLRLGVELLQPGDPSLPGDVAAILAGDGAGQPPPVNAPDRQHISGYAMIRGVDDRPAFVGRVTDHRKVYEHGLKTQRYYGLSLLVVSAVVMSLLIGLLNRTIINRLRQLSFEVNEIGRTENITALRFAPDREEIGSLARNIGRMLSQLNRARSELVESCYRSGLEEMASGTLHNISNAISLALVQTVLLRDNILKLPFAQFETAKKELGTRSLGDSRKGELIRMMTEGNGHLLGIMHNNAEELASVIDRISHVEAILSDGREFAGSRRPTEEISIMELVAGAINLFKLDHGDSLSIQTGPELTHQKPVMGHRLLLRQVLDNILVNAAEAIHKNGSGDGRIVIRTYADELNGKQAVHIEISDNGPGISPGALGKIFQRGYSTKGENASGLGLRWCASTVNAMNGRIFEESEGMEQGALFHILMPSND